MTKFDKRLDTLEGVGGGFNPRDYVFICTHVDDLGNTINTATGEVVPARQPGEFGGTFVFTSGNDFKPQ